MVTWAHFNFILFTSVIAVTSVLWIYFNYTKYKIPLSAPHPMKMAQKKMIDNPILMKMNDFQYTINNYPCFDNDIFLITYIHSAPKNIMNRNTIRTTWGMLKDICGKKIRVVFLLGKVSEVYEQNEIAKENVLYGDIIQGNFVDSYNNLTYKNVMGLKWISEFCANAKFVLKTDDDIYVDIFKLFKLLVTVYKNSSKELVACNEWIGMGVIRDPDSKWYISESQYPGETFSPYCSGWAYVLTTDVASRLYEISSQFFYLFIDDFLVSGLMVDEAGYKRKPINELYTFGSEALETWLLDNDNKPCQYMVGWYGDDFNLARKLGHKTFLTWIPNIDDMCPLSIETEAEVN